eukprot:TRINITY_DN9117_c0_g1_i1.p1 TRINITY_DN9117_c0_g1~~TRINITY_DN9117_c0_g1_i1.p1  ORF type:complete len:406 (+),score=107.44 TRINITY_DN9117_c0_g1_i1:55-1272(+)
MAGRGAAAGRRPSFRHGVTSARKMLTTTCVGVAALFSWEVASRWSATSSSGRASQETAWVQLQQPSQSALVDGRQARFLQPAAALSSLTLGAAKGFDPVAEAVDPMAEAAKKRAQEEMKRVSELQGKLEVQAMGGGPGSFLLNMGGMKLLVNPKLDASSPIQPEKIHEMVDYVVITSAKEEYLDPVTIERMKLMKVNFIASATAGEVLERMLVRNLAILMPGPGGRVLLTAEEGKAPVGVLVTPGANSPMPWGTPESGFLFVNMKTGLCVAYEATGQFLGPDARSEREGIPEEAYQLDYLITPDLTEAAGVSRGLTMRGAMIRGVVKLPDVGGHAKKEESNPLVDAYISAEKTVDSLISGGDDVKSEIGESEQEFIDFLQKMGRPLADTKLITPAAAGEPVVLES